MSATSIRKIKGKYRYWKATVTIKKQADGTAEVTYPITTVDGLGGEFFTYVTETITGQAAKLIDKVDNLGRLHAKTDYNTFTFYEAMTGLPFVYGYRLSDF